MSLGLQVVGFWLQGVSSIPSGFQVKGRLKQVSVLKSIGSGVQVPLASK